MASLFSGSQWSSSPVCYWTLEYEHRRVAKDMQYRFKWRVWVKNSTSWYYNGIQLRLFINGVQNNVTVKGYDTSEKGWDKSGTTDWYTVSNKTSGTVPFYASLYDTNSKTTEKTSSTYNLTVSGAGSELGTISNFDMDDTLTIPITKYDSTFTDTLTISCGDVEMRTISNITNGAKVTFTDAEKRAIYKLMQYVKSETFTFALTTKSGSTEIGTSTKTATGSISNANPVFTSKEISYRDSNESIATNLTKNDQLIVQNKSNLMVTLTAATQQKGASISKYELTLNGVTKTVNSAGDVDFGTINSSQDLTLSVKVTDSRGNTATATKKITMLEYAEPTVDITLKRLNNYENKTFLTVNVGYSPVNDTNKIVIQCIHKKQGETAVTKAIENGVEYEFDCDKNSVYEFKIKVFDVYGALITRDVVLPKGKFPLYISTKKNAVGINDFPVDDEALRVAEGIAHFLDGAKIGGKTIADFPIERTTVNGWNVTKWSSGWCELSRTEHFEGIDVKGVWGSLSTGYIVGSDIAYPEEFNELPCCTVTPDFYKYGNIWIATCDEPGSTTKTPKYQLVRPTAAEGVSVTLNYRVCGYLKEGE